MLWIWFSRVYGELGVGPCRARLGEWKLKKGEVQRASYRFVIYTGDFSRERIEAAWKDQTHEPPPERGVHYNLTPAEATRAMTAAEGFDVKLYAAEPEVRQPHAFCIDDRGRLWIAEDYTYSKYDWLPDQRDRIVIFDDSDGDGRADSHKVFTEDITYASGIETGHGGVWVGSPPNLLFIPDRDGDDVPDSKPRVVLDGWGAQDQHETMNSFRWGPDGWLYGCQGVFVDSRVGKPGTPDNRRVEMNGGVWRYHPIREEFEVFSHGTSNPYGFDFNDKGQMIVTACVIPHLWHFIQGGRFHYQTGRHPNRYTYDDIKTIADHSHENFRDRDGGHAHGGAIFYMGESFPDSYRGKLFMFNLHHRSIYTDLVTRRGSGWVGSHDGEVLFANDPWFIGFSLQYGPDGEIYFIDWYDERVCHGQTPEGKETGRIYRLSYGNVERNIPDWSKLESVELAELQLDRNGWKVRRARRILSEPAAEGADMTRAHGKLRVILETHPNVPRKLRALWALHVSGGTNEKLLSQLLNHDNEFLRAWAIQLELEDRQAPEAILAIYATMARQDPSPVVRLYLASALQRLPLAQRWDIAEALLSHAEDIDDHNLPLMYWYGIEPLVPADKRRALRLAIDCKIPLVRRFIARRAASR